VETLERFPTVTVLDCHSFSSQAIPAGNGDLPLPDICLGSDEFHTPPELLDMLESRFVERGFTVRRNFPFAGSMVPAKFLGCDRRVRSVMVEIRRGLYCDEDTGRKNSEFENLRGELESILVPLCAV
jgi:N-formylglutamate amidohydrolase